MKSTLIKSFVADETTCDILEQLPRKKRSEFIREAIIAKHNSPAESKFDIILKELTELKEIVKNGTFSTTQESDDDLVMDAIESSLEGII